jgi:uncharacterized protein (DUF58 family)
MEARLRKYLAEGEQAARRYSLGIPRHAPVGVSGATLSHRAGSSLEFKDHRAYEPGDDLRHIDWHAFARTDQLTIKLFREEVIPHIDVVLDASRSMDLEDTGKGGAGIALAAFFAGAGARAGYSHSAWMMADRYRPIEGGKASAALWTGIAYDHVGGPGPGMPSWRPRGTRVLISDLFWLGDPLMTLRPFSERSAVTVVMHLLARADVDPPEGKSFRLVDSETGEMREIHVDAVVARRYREGLARHQENWHLACRQIGAVFVRVVAEDLLREWNLDELVAAEVLKVC